MVQVPLSTPPTREETLTLKQDRRHIWRWQQIVLYAFLALLTITSLGPFIFAFFSSFKTFSHILDFPPTLFPQPWTFANFASLLAYPGFLHWILNSFIVSLSVAVLNCFFQRWRAMRSRA
jgi:ABC-type glycerol-3-phosphate transport system permease component